MPGELILFCFSTLKLIEIFCFCLYIVINSDKEGFKICYFYGNVIREWPLIFTVIILPDL